MSTHAKTASLDLYGSKRPVVTRYYLDDKIICTNRSSISTNAVVNAVKYMQMNTYGAQLAEVFDHTTGKLFANIVSEPNGDLYISYSNL